MTMSKIVSDELRKILDKYDTFTVLEVREKIRCELSGHEMPCRIDALESYIKGKKFMKLFEKHRYQYEKQHLTQSNKKGRGHQLFCTLTLRHINNTPKHIQKHFDGRRFKKALARWEECQKTGEIFKPNRPQQRQNYSDTEITSEADDSAHGEKETEDNFDDLYPAEDFKGSDSDDQSDSDVDVDDVEGQRLKADISQQDQSDSDYDCDNYESENKPKHESRSEKDVSVTKKPQGKRKLKSVHTKQKKAKT